MKRFMFVLLILIGLSSCGSPRLDTSTDEALQGSIARARKSLPESRREEFDAALLTITMSNLDLSSVFVLGADANPDKLLNDAKAVLNGKTAEEVIEAADRVVAAQKAAEKESALKEIAELLKERERAQKMKSELAKFEVLRSRFYKRESEWRLSAEPIIELRVRNGTSHAVSHAYFRGVLSSPGRSVPWLSEEFNCAIAGGIEPGEEKSWSLAPNSFSEWGRVETPKDAGLFLTVLRVDGADGEALFDASGFDDASAARLAALQKEYGKDF